MRKFILSFLCLLLLSTTAHAYSIDILSETYHTWGCAGPGNCYDVTSTGSPITAEVWYSWESSYGEETALSRASAGDFEVATNAGGWGAQLSAESEASFLFDVPSTVGLLLDLSINGSQPMIETNCSIFLTDSSTGQDLLSIQNVSDLGPYQFDYTFEPQYSFTLEPNKLYELSLYSFSTSSEDVWDNSVRATMNIAPVPEPASMVIMGIGLAALFVAHRRKKLSKSVVSG